MTRLVVELNDVERKLAEHVAKCRTRVARTAGVQNRRVSAASDADIDRLGFAGELAFCKLFNLYPDLTPQPKRGGADAEWFGYAIDVKTSPRGRGRLIAVPGGRGIDRYALMVTDRSDGWRFRFVGFATAAELAASADVLPDIGRGVAHTVAQADLHSTIPIGDPDGV